MQTIKKLQCMKNVSWFWCPFKIENQKCKGCHKNILWCLFPCVYCRTFLMWPQFLEDWEKAWPCTYRELFPLMLTSKEPFLDSLGNWTKTICCYVDLVLKHISISIQVCAKFQDWAIWQWWHCFPLQPSNGPEGVHEQLQERRMGGWGKCLWQPL